jgi:hypothetical protein
MGMDKAIESGKEKRKKYYGAKSSDSTCNNHGSCRASRENRQHKNRKRKLTADDQLKNT